MKKNKLLYIILVIMGISISFNIPSYAQDRIEWNGRIPIPQKQKFNFSVPKVNQYESDDNWTYCWIYSSGVQLQILNIKEGYNDSYWEIEYKGNGTISAGTIWGSNNSRTASISINNRDISWDDSNYGEDSKSHTLDGTIHTINIPKDYYNPMKLTIAYNLYARHSEQSVRSNYSYTFNMNMKPYLSNQIDRQHINGKDSSSITVKGKVRDVEQDDITVIAEIKDEKHQTVLSKTKYIDIPNKEYGQTDDYEFTFNLSEFPKDVNGTLYVTARDHYGDTSTASYNIYIDRINPVVSTTDYYIIKGGTNIKVQSNEPCDVYLLKNNRTYSLFTEVENALSIDGYRIGNCDGMAILPISSTINGPYRLYAVDRGKNVSKPFDKIIQIDSKKPELIDIIVEDNKIKFIYEELMNNNISSNDDILLPRENVISSSVCILSDEDKVNYEFIFDDYEDDQKYIDRFIFNAFDNSMFTNQNGTPNIIGTTATNKNTFHEVGKYSLEYQAKDTPIQAEEESFANYRRWGNKNNIELLVHRRPIANIGVTATVQGDEWHINSIIGNGYDLDHMDLPNKGIIEEKWDWKSKKGNWVDGKISNNVPLYDTDGEEEEYLVRYKVKDIEGAWSFPAIYTITSQAIFSMDAKIRTSEERFSLDSLPATEQFEIYDIVTECNREIKYIKIELINSEGTVVLSTPQIRFTQGITGNRLGDKINWNPIKMVVPETAEDGDYNVRLTVEREDLKLHTKNYQLKIYTPVWEDYSSGKMEVISEPLKNLPESLLLSYDTSFSEKNEITFITSKYTSKVSVNISEIAFFVYKNNMAGQDQDKASVYIKNDNKQQYKVSNIVVNSDGFQTVWKFDLSLVAGKPYEGDLQKDIVFNAYDTAGRYDTTNYKHGLNPQSVNLKLLDLKLENLRITNITDPDFKYLFETEAGRMTNLQKNGIQVKDFAVYRNNKNHLIALGYKVYFKIDSIGLYESADTIDINVYYYALDNNNKLYLVDAYVTDENGNYIKLENSNYYTKTKSIELNHNHRHNYEMNPASTSKNTWYFELYLPYNTKFVKHGQALDLFNGNTFKNKVLVVYDIIAKKNSSSSTYDYTMKEMDWGMDTGSTYGKNLSTDRELLGKKINHGEIFWYDLTHTAMDDFLMNRDW
ncbi:hypothetical protein [Vallitalea guaymasensis]|uniref:hypothetical protein n=1 Tax=Vallitalea guaymasensis TaxID=1185412 RepID=UPI000DE3B85E|nr:hypothetical protein [Vallitalea guaymasensis]